MKLVIAALLALRRRLRMPSCRHLGRHVDDGALDALGDHGLCDQPGRLEGAEDVDGEDALPVAPRRFERIDMAHDSRAIDEAVDGAERPRWPDRSPRPRPASPRSATTPVTAPASGPRLAIASFSACADIRDDDGRPLGRHVHRGRTRLALLAPPGTR